jgi:hypothetical protein
MPNLALNSRSKSVPLVSPQIGKSGLALSLSTTATGYRAISGEQFTIHSLPWLATLGGGAFGHMTTELGFKSKWGCRIPIGVVSWADRLPDGSAFAGSSRLNSTLKRFGLWASLRKNQASLAGESHLAGLDYLSGITPRSVWPAATQLHCWRSKSLSFRWRLLMIHWGKVLF